MATVIAVLSFSPEARASFIVLDGNVPQIDENILINNDDVGTSIEGMTNSSGEVVVFTSPSQFLAGPSGGQARVEGRSANDINSSDVDINDSIFIALGDPGKKFGSLIFNAFDGIGSLIVKITGVNADDTPALATITLDDDANPLTVSNGSNFYTVVATGGMLMTSVEIALSGGSSYTDLRQVRIGGVVPEPATAVLGCAAALCCVTSTIRRRSR